MKPMPAMDSSSMLILDLVSAQMYGRKYSECVENVQCLSCGASPEFTDQSQVAYFQKYALCPNCANRTESWANEQ